MFSIKIISESCLLIRIFLRDATDESTKTKYKLTKTNLVDALRNTTKKAILDVKKWSKDDVPLKTSGQESLIWDSINPLTRVWARPRHCTNPAIKFKMSRPKMIQESICLLKKRAIFATNFTEVIVPKKKIARVEIQHKFDYKRHNFSINNLVLAAELIR